MTYNVFGGTLNTTTPHNFVQVIFQEQFDLMNFFLVNYSTEITFVRYITVHAN